MTINRKRPPVLGPVKKLHATEPVLQCLSNKIPVYILEAGDQDIIRVDIIFQAGSRYQKTIFQASFVNSLLLEGTATKSARQIADEIDFYGSYINPGTDRDEAHIQVYSLNKFLPYTLDLAADIIMNPTFSENELNIFRQKRLQAMAIENQKAESRARKTFFRTIFGEQHPYGQIGEPQDINAITRSDIANFHSSYYHAAHCGIILSGKNAGVFLPLIEERFGNWNGSGEKPGILFSTGPVQKPANFEILEEVKGAVQAAIRIGGIMPDKCHENYSGLNITNTILGGYFGSRLMQNIREDKGYTYGVGSSLHSFKENGIFLISTDVGQENYKASLKECFKEIDLLCSKAVTDKELSRVRQYIEGEILRQLDGPFNLADSFRSLLTFGLDFSYLETFLNVLNQITPSDIQKLALKYFGTNPLVQVVAGIPAE